MYLAITSVLGLVIGAVLQFLFTRYLDNKKHQRDMRARAYSDYLESVSEHANLSLNKSSSEGRLLAAKTADAKCRISLYGAPDVIKAFAVFENLGATMNTSEQQEAFTSMVIAMRADTLGSKQDVSKEEVRALLLGNGS